jgi:hypothetical protein
MLLYIIAMSLAVTAAAAATGEDTTTHTNGHTRVAVTPAAPRHSEASDGRAACFAVSW